VPDDWAPEDGWQNAEVPEPMVLAEGLATPRGVASWNGGLVFAEAGSGRVVAFEDGSEKVVVEDLGEPWAVIVWGEDLVVGDRAGGRILKVGATGEVEILAEGLTTPGQLAASGDRACWLDEAGTMGCSDWLGEILAVEAPLGIAMEGDVAWVTSSEGLLEVDLVARTSSVVVSPVETPQDVLLHEGQLALSTRSTRWPYGGWIYVVEGTEAVGTSHSPPEPLWLAANADSIYWSSKQSITRVSWEGGAYENVALRTAVGGLTVADELGLVWTDWERGLLLQALD
jgi:hypothetical protein